MYQQNMKEDFWYERKKGLINIMSPLFDSFYSLDVLLRRRQACPMYNTKLCQNIDDVTLISVKGEQLKSRKLYTSNCWCKLELEFTAYNNYIFWHCNYKS